MSISKERHIVKGNITLRQIIETGESINHVFGCDVILDNGKVKVESLKGFLNE
jgi:hypothetical protein